MAYTQQDIDDLKAALASGVRRVTHENTTTEYASREEMLQQLALMEQEVAAAKPRIRRVLFTAGKGL